MAGVRGGRTQRDHGSRARRRAVAQIDRTSCSRMSHTSELYVMGVKRSGAITRPSSRLIRRAQERAGLSPGIIRPPTYHQSGCGCTTRLPVNTCPLLEHIAQ